ncbi:MAG: PilT/PilU family type 4a pilus ATPase [Myxococcales bacterium]
MRRLDFYVQHMLKQNAHGVVMRSGEPVEFRFAQGDIRRSNQSISHGQVLQLVREVSPPDGLEQLRRSGHLRFTTRGQAGAGIIYVAIDVNAPEQWRVILSTHEIDSSYDTPAPPESGGEEWGGFASPREPMLDLPRAPDNAAASQMRRAPSPPSIALPTNQAAGAAQPPATPPAPRQSASPAPAPRSPARVVVRDSQAEARLQRFLRHAVSLKASDLHMSTGSEPMVRIDGEMRVLQNTGGELRAEDMLDMMMAIAPPDVRQSFEQTHDSDFAYELEGAGRFRFNFFLDRRGPGLVARQIPMEILTPEQIGLPQAVVDLCWLSRGLVLVTGPTGSGKSTTLAALIDFINRNRSDHIITIEDPIEYVHPNKRCLVNQRQVGLHTPSFNQALRAALREDPDVIVVGEMRDLETISIAIETAETGHLVFGTLHTTTAASTVDRIIDQFPADEQGHIRSMLSESLRGVVSQVLCKKNGGGRAAAYEILLMNAAAQNMVREGKTFQIKSMMQTARAQGMQTMNDHLFELVKGNVIDVKDAYLKATDKAGFRELLQKAHIRLDPAMLLRTD